MEVPHLDMPFRITFDKNFLASWFKMESILIIPSMGRGKKEKDVNKVMFLLWALATYFSSF